MFTSRAIPITLTLLLAALSAVAQTQQPNPQPESTDATVTGSITGRVVDESGQPLPNAMVMVRAAGSSRPEQAVATDRDGAFRVSGLEAIPYTIFASMAAYTLPFRDPNSTVRPVTTYRIGDTVTLTLIRGGVVTGSVVNANGEAVVGVNVRVQMIRDINGRLLRTGYRREKSTDDRGVYRIYGLPTGTYVVMAGGSPLYSHGNFNPFDRDAPTYAPSATRDNAAEISIRTGEETGGVDIRYRGEPARVVSGRVNLPQNSVAGTQVSITTADETSIPWSSTVYEQPGTSTFMFTGVPDGDYYVYAQSHLRNEGPTYSDAKRINVRGADVTGIELSTRPLGSVAGRIVLEESKAPECAGKTAPVFNELSVAAWHKEDEAAKQVPQFFWSLGGPVSPDKEGNFKLLNLAAGEYHFIPRGVSRYWYVQSVLLTPNAKTTKPIDTTRVWTSVKPGDRLSGLTITLAQGAAGLRGQLTLGEGEMVPAKLWVYLVPLERERADDVLRFFGSAVSPEKRFTFGNVAPGRYWLVTRAETEDGAAPLTKLRLPHETQIRGRLRREAEAAKTEIELKPCQTVADYTLALKSANPN
ncbi:MAG: carboxypeptidase-like regulatory domain-containing protein [Acidobacteria bacterium]|nr:carboxypeptidase-like regulatory domain-containing protein [Acidobacteriota bacterium]